MFVSEPEELWWWKRFEVLKSVNKERNGGWTLFFFFITLIEGLMTCNEWETIGVICPLSCPELTPPGVR